MITELRPHYKPFEYQTAFEFYKQQHQAHWLADEVPLSSDLNDWKMKLSESEKNLIGNILKSFAQTETYVNDYWATKVAVWFPKHEIKAMACAFADFESIHAEAYARLNEELGLDDFEAFMEDEEAKAKIDRLVELPGDTLREKALSLAIFSAFTEGVNLFSSFAILMSFQLRNLMKGTGQIVEWSVRDESLHSKAGCWLFRTLLEECPELDTKELTQSNI
jgi:ribonucleoside-diphosphate reductase beta chain